VLRRLDLIRHFSMRLATSILCTPWTAGCGWWPPCEAAPLAADPVVPIPVAPSFFRRLFFSRPAPPRFPLPPTSSVWACARVEVVSAVFRKHQSQCPIILRRSGTSFWTWRTRERNWRCETGSTIEPDQTSTTFCDAHLSATTTRRRATYILNPRSCCPAEHSSSAISSRLPRSSGRISEA
jgi:hypothetical protein